jgi:hypothetical protein
VCISHAAVGNLVCGSVCLFNMYARRYCYASSETHCISS